MNSRNYFEITEGVLNLYRGPGGHVIIPEGVTEIGGKEMERDREDVLHYTGAFQECRGLKSVLFPGSLRIIGDKAFKGCDELTSITVPEGVLHIGHRAFANCTNLREVVLPNSLQTIGGGAFYNCQKLKKVFLPDNLRMHDVGAFEACGQVEFIVSHEAANQSGNFVIKNGILEKYKGPGGAVIVPAGVKGIGSQAFELCTTLVSVVLPEGVTHIDAYGFFACYNLRQLVWPESLKSIGVGAFRECSSLLPFSLPEKLETIGSEAFRRCSALIDQNGFLIVSGILFGYYGDDRDVVVPEGVTRIDEEVFLTWGLLRSYLQSITLPESLTNIGAKAFHGCSGLTDVVIPENVTSIGARAFGNCENLKSFKVKGKKTVLEEDVFGDFLPAGLRNQVGVLWPYMTAGALEQYVLRMDIWDTIAPAQQREIKRKISEKGRWKLRTGK